MADKEQKSSKSDTEDNKSLTRRGILGTAGAVAVSGLLSGVGSGDEHTSSEEFDPVEANSWEIRRGYETGAFTAVEVVEAYLDRILAYEDQLQAVITINPNAIQRAEELDEAAEPGGARASESEESGSASVTAPRDLVGPLHGVPVLVKDNCNTDDIPTTTGTVAMEDSIPTESADIVQNIRDAGGIVIAKANMDEFAFGYTSSSSMGGTVYNPYNLERTSGGSSGGSGTGMGANYAAIGIGTDTGGSVRVPSLANSLVGLRPTRQLVSGAGVSPLYSRQDVPGPMARTVADTALMLDVLAAPSPGDGLTYHQYGKTPYADGNRYTDFLNEDGLDGARIGVYADWMPEGEIREQFESVFDEMEDAGATIVSYLESPPDDLTDSAYRSSTINWDWLNYLETIEEYDSIEDLALTGELESCGITFALEEPETIEGLKENVEFSVSYYNQRELQQYILSQMERDDLDMVMYPGNQDVPTPDYSEDIDWGPANLQLSPILDWPSIVMPVGFREDSGVPIGMEFLAPKFEESKLIEAAYAFEQLTEAREPPADFGPVEGEGGDWDADDIAMWNEARPVYNTVGEACDIPDGSSASTSPQDLSVDTRNLPGSTDSVSLGGGTSSESGDEEASDEQANGGNLPG